jgi:hypothetical protein
MSGRQVWVMGVWLAAGTAAFGQSVERRAVMTGGGNQNEGKCTVEVVVDGSAQVEIRGDRAVLRTTGGRPSEWRRFECSSPMPANAAGVQFQGIDGRGSQRLIGDPRRGGAAVVQIDDPSGGSEGYTFDLFWGGFGRPGAGGPGPGPGPGPGRYDGNNRPDVERRYEGDRRPDGDGRYDGDRRRFAVEDAIRVCQDSVRDRAADQMPGARIDFNRTTIDDNPGRQDWVLGTFDARRGRGRAQTFRFNCSVNFDSGRVRTADFSRIDRR